MSVIYHFSGIFCTRPDGVRAGELFLQNEGCDFDPAAEVAVAPLFQALERKTIGKNELILLSITEGDYTLLKQHRSISAQQVDLLLTRDDLKDKGLLGNISRKHHSMRSYTEAGNA